MPQVAADAQKTKNNLARLRGAQATWAQGMQEEWLVDIWQARGPHHPGPGAKLGQPHRGLMERIISLEQQVKLLTHLVADLHLRRSGEEVEQSAGTDEGKNDMEAQSEGQEEIDNEQVAIKQSLSTVALTGRSEVLFEDRSQRVMHAINELEEKKQQRIPEAYPTFLGPGASTPAAAAHGHAAAGAAQEREELELQGSREATEQVDKGPQKRADVLEFVPKAEEGALTATEGAHQPPIQSASCTAAGSQPIIDKGLFAVGTRVYISCLLTCWTLNGRIATVLPAPPGTAAGRVPLRVDAVLKEGRVFLPETAVAVRAECVTKDPPYMWPS